MALVPLAAVMRSPDRRAVELARFSRAIPTAIILVIASGISLTIVQLRQVDALWTTGYGLVLCGKLIAVMALLALAALNRYALTPRVVAGDSIAAGRQITLTVLDGQFGPLLAKEVTLVLTKPDAGIEALRLPAAHVENTDWRIDQVHLPILGDWQVRLEILISDFEKVTLEDKVELRR
jgi:copper transport protein